MYYYEDYENCSFRLPEAVAQLLNDKLKEVANHTRQFSKKKRFQSNDISENSSLQTSELSKDMCTEENLSLREQSMNNATVIDEMGSKSDTSRLIQSNEDESLLTISKNSLEFSQMVPCQSTPEKRKEISANELEHDNEEQISSLNQNCALSSKPKLYQSNLIEQNNKHMKRSKTDVYDPVASSELKSSATDFSNQEYEQNNKRISPQLLSPSPTVTTMTDTTMMTDTTITMTDTTTTDTTTTTMTTTMTMTTKTTAPYISVLRHLKKSR